MNRKQMIAMLAAVVLAATMMSGCGKKEEEKGNPNIVRREESQAEAGSDQGDAAQSNGAENATGETTQENTNQTPEKEYDVLLEERTEEEKYTYSLDDLSLVDTVSGKKISIGMAKSEFEAVAGSPMIEQPDFVVYNGVIVQYTQDETVGSMVVSGGMIQNEDEKTRYKTTRGVSLTTSFEDFTKAYGDQFNEKTTSGEGENATETPSNAIRYFKMDGDKIEYLGTSLTAEQEANEEGNLYVQDFMFGKENNLITSMRITSLDMMGR